VVFSPPTHLKEAVILQGSCGFRADTHSPALLLFDSTKVKLDDLRVSLLEQFSFYLYVRLVQGLKELSYGAYAQISIE